MPRERDAIENGLVNKGFQKTNADHRRFIYYTQDGKTSSINTKTSHSHRDISDNLMGQMAKQCRVTKQQFLSLVDCTLSQPDYERSLVSAGHLSTPN